MNHKWFYLIIGIALIISSCQKENKKSEATSSAVPVVTTRVKKISVNQPISISGNIEGNRTVRLGFMVAGKINYIGKDEGRWFAKDQLIASLDPANYSIAKEMADVQVAQVQDEYNRLKAMFDQHSISESDFAKISFGLQQAKAQQKLQEKNLADTKLYAPFSGVLLKKLGEVGEITGVGIPQFVFSDISKVKVSAFIPENELHMIKIGQEASALISAVNETFTGKIVEVGSAADPASRSFSVKVELDNPKMLILPGMIAEVTIPSGNTSEVLTVPVESILHDINNQSFLFVSDLSQGKAYKRTVALGKLYNDNIEITSGVSENEPIIIAGQQKLVDGASFILQKQ
jgi:membrane fusion protein, multidrug efflux system